MNSIFVITVVSVLILLAIFGYVLMRRREDVSPTRRSPTRRSPFSPLPPLSRPVSGAGRYDSSDDASALLAAQMATEPSHHAHAHSHTASPAPETHTAPSHAAPSHDHGSSYGGDSYGGHHDSGSSYSGGHDSGGGFDGGGGGHGH